MPAFAPIAASPAGRGPIVLAGMRSQNPHVPGLFITVRVAYPFVAPIPNFSDTGRLAVDVWSSDGATYLGTIPVVLVAQVHEAIGSVSSFSLSVPAEYKTVISVGNMIKITREGEGVIFVGYADVLGVDDV